MKTGIMKFDIQYKEVAGVAKKIEKLAQELYKVASTEGSPNDIYGYSSEIVNIVRTITPVIGTTPANEPLFSEIPHFVKIKNTVRGR
ncbi:hypothetical protein DW182_15680 [Bacteroides sp. AM16-24]|jgi:hypothetical protein|nr:hypothetical protein DW182_15680 [Bacteroides sp. AM16-24]